MVHLLLLPFQLLFAFISLILFVVFLPIKLILSLSFGLVGLIGGVFLLGAIIVSVFVASAFPGLIILLIGVGLVAIFKN